MNERIEDNCSARAWRRGNKHVDGHNDPAPDRQSQHFNSCDLSSINTTKYTQQLSPLFSSVATLLCHTCVSQKTVVGLLLQQT